MLLLPFIAAIVFVGVYPKPMIDRIQPSVDALITHIEEQKDVNWTPPEPAVVEVPAEEGEG